jgi:DNA-binding transcriptional MerR regulator
VSNLKIGQTTFNNSHEKCLSRSETAKLLHVTEVTFNNWEKKNILVPSRNGRHVLYKETDVISRLDDARDPFYNGISIM